MRQAILEGINLSRPPPPPPPLPPPAFLPPAMMPPFYPMPPLYPPRPMGGMPPHHPHHPHHPAQHRPRGFPGMPQFIHCLKQVVLALFPLLLSNFFLIVCCKQNIWALRCPYYKYPLCELQSRKILLEHLEQSENWDLYDSSSRWIYTDLSIKQNRFPFYRLNRKLSCM